VTQETKNVQTLEVPLPRAARRLLLGDIERGQAAVAQAQNEAAAALQRSAHEVRIDLGIPDGVKCDLMRDEKGMPYAMRYEKPAEAPAAEAKKPEPAAPEAAPKPADKAPRAPKARKG
jgi:hypothetical protein